MLHPTHLFGPVDDKCQDHEDNNENKNGHERLLSVGWLRVIRPI